MPLFHINKSKNIKPSDLEKSDLFLTIPQKLGHERFVKVCNMFDKLIDRLQPSESSQLTWASFGSLVGENGIATKEEYDYLWKSFYKVFNDESQAKILFGVFGQWRFACHSKEWLAYKQDTGITNSEGEEITRTSYWIKKAA